MKLSASRAIPLVLVAVLAACVPRTAPTPPVTTPAPAPAPLPQPAPPPASSNWMDAAQTPGDWSYRSRASGGGIAAFGSYGIGGDEPLFSLACERETRSIVLSRSGSSREDTPGRMVVRTESATRSLPALRSRPTASGRGAATTARLPAGDRLLDAMALSKGRFAIEVDDREALYLPSWAEVTRVIEDCR